MSIDVNGRYPRVLQLPDGRKLDLRPMSRADEWALVQFFEQIPEDERFFLKDEVTSPRVIRNWIEMLDYNRAFPLLALQGHRVVGDAALLLHRSASLAHSAEVRVVIDPEFREQGLAVAMIKELIAVAKTAGLEELVFELVADQQDRGIETAEAVGAKRAGTLKSWVRDSNDAKHDM